MANDEIWTPFDPNNDTYKYVSKQTGLNKNLVRNLTIMGIVIGGAYVEGRYSVSKYLRNLANWLRNL